MRQPQVLFFITLAAMFWNVHAASKAFEELENFLTANGHRYVDILFNSSSQRSLVAFRPKAISIARLKMDDAYKADKNGFGVILFDKENDDIMTMLHMIVQRRVQMSLLLLIEQTMTEIMIIKKHLHTLGAVGLLYMAVLDTSGLSSWHHVISLKTGTVICPLTFADNSLQIVETYNLQGLTIRSTTLPWEPFYAIGDCDREGLECKTNHGYLADYMDMLALKFNFTYTSHRNTDNDWGVLPKRGPFSLNGTWSGVMGDVINKRYDMSISTWRWKLERTELAQFVPIVRERLILMSGRQRPKTDFGLLNRGFTKISWISIFMLLIILFIFILLQRVVSQGKYGESLKILVFSTALLFVMIRAYYSAALTKFFTVTMPQPFETERDVIRAYPSWYFMFKQGAQVYVYAYVLQGDADYIAFWERHLRNPEKTTYKSVAEALKHIENGKTVIQGLENQVLGFLRSNPPDEHPHIFGHGSWMYPALLFHLNSPLLPMFKQGTNYFRERGIESQLFIKWIGQDNTSGSSLLDSTVLTLSQVILAFTFVASFYGLSLIILGGEVAAKNVVKRIKRTKPDISGPIRHVHLGRPMFRRRPIWSRKQTKWTQPPLTLLNSQARRASM